MEGGNSPLALNAWDIHGPNSYMAALQVVDTVIDTEKNEFYRDNHQLANYIANALHARIVSQSDANNKQYQGIAHKVGEDDSEYIRGNKSPSELLGYLMWHDELESIEIGRRTMPRVWNTKPLVDGPIRSDLDEAKVLATKKRKSPALYRTKNLNLNDESGKYFVQIDRKRVVRQHFGGRILTVVRNSIVLHNGDKADPLPRDVRLLIQGERQRAKNERDYDYDEHRNELGEYMEPYVLTRNDGEKPGWMIPILTTYYAVKEEALKADRLKEVSES